MFVYTLTILFCFVCCLTLYSRSDDCSIFQCLKLKSCVLSFPLILITFFELK